MRIGKLCFGSDDFQHGLELCLYKAGLEAKNVDKFSSAHVDILLVTMFWFRDIYLFEKFRRDSGLLNKKDKPVIVVGGLQATLTPKLVAKQADYVFVGDGDDYLGDIVKDISKGKRPRCKYIYADGDETVPEPAECDPIAFAIKKKGKGTGNTMRIEIARGCKFKCKFCVLSQLKCYREVPTDQIIELLNREHKKGQNLFALFAPERLLHSGWDRIQDEIDRLGVTNVGVDTRLENLDRVTNRKVTFGLEGISYKLRKSIGKRFSDKMILGKFEKYVSNLVNIGRVTVYFIADLPGEEEEDWEELYELFVKMENEEWSRRITLTACLNPLSPKPFTPLANAEIHPYRDYSTKWQDFLRKNNNGHWGFRIQEVGVWGPWVRVLDSLIYRGGPQAYEFIKKMPNKYLTTYPKQSKQLVMAKQLVKEIEKYDISAEQLFAPKQV